MEYDYLQLFMYIFIGFVVGIVVYRDAKYYVYKQNPLLWTLFVLLFPFGFFIYLAFRKRHIPKNKK